MAWWRKSTAEQPNPSGFVPVAVEAEAQAEQDRAYDIIADIVRSVGDTSFDSAEEDLQRVRQFADAWARHVLVAAPPPGQDTPRHSARRNWSGVRKFVADQLQDRSVLFQKTTDDLRDIVHAFIHSVSKVVHETGQTDRVVAEQLERLREAVASDSLTRMRDEAMAVAANISGAIESRQQRQRRELAVLTGRIHTLRSQLETARKRSELDPLTQLANRRAFDEHVAATVDFARLTGASASLLFADVDHFKQVNDSFGHAAGDAALSRVADELVRTFPRRGDLVARYGGEEFCVVLRDTDADSANRLASRLLMNARKLRVHHQAQTFGITLSIGVAALRAEDQPEDWVRRADEAMYSAKRAGRDRVGADGAAGDGLRSTG